MDEVTIKKLLGLRIKQLRKQRNLTQFALGEKIGMDQRQIAHIEGGKSFPSLRTLKNLSEVFSCGLKDLFDYEHLMEREVLKADVYKRIEAADDAGMKVYYSVIRAIENSL